MQRIVIIGAGPSGLAYLERLVSNASVGDAMPLDIHVVDPYPAGSGRIWRYEQSPALLLNSQAYDITIFPDDNFTGQGPVPADADRLTFLGWIDEVRSGRISLPDDVDDGIRSEIEMLTSQTFPTRRLMALYLRWAYRYVIENAPANISVATHQTHVVSVDEGLRDELSVTLGNGATIRHVNAAIYTVGHCEREPTE